MKQIVFLNYRRLLRESLEAFRSAKHHGWQIVLVAQNAPDVLLDEIDFYLEADITDFEELKQVKQILLQRPVVSVVCFTETAIEAASWLSKELGLIGLPTSAVPAARNKAEMRSRTSHIYPLKTRVDIEQDEIMPFLRDVGGRIILKPINSSGSQGIFLIESEDDLHFWKVHGQTVSAPKYDLTMKYDDIVYVGEEYINGTEYSVEGFVSKGRITIVGVTAKEVSDRYKLELQHIFPADLPISAKKNIVTDSVRYIQALGLDNTSFHLEGKLDGNKFHMIEVAARPAGDYIASHLIPNAVDYDYYGNLINVSLGVKPEKPGPTRVITGIQFISAQVEGVFEGLNGLRKALSHPYVKHIFIEVPFGTIIKLPPENFRLQRLAAVISSAGSHAALKQHFEQVKSSLIPVIT